MIFTYSMATTIIYTFFLFTKFSFITRFTTALIIKAIPTIKTSFSTFFSTTIYSFPISITNTTSSLANSMIIAIIGTSNFMTVFSNKAWFTKAFSIDTLTISITIFITYLLRTINTFKSLITFTSVFCAFSMSTAKIRA